MEGFIRWPVIASVMKKEMSAFDVLRMVQDMQCLIGGFVDKVFQWEGNILLRINVQGVGKQELFFKGLKWLYMPEEKPEAPDFPSNFAVYLRKNISNARIDRIEQKEFDRVVILHLQKGEDMQLIFEMFGGGNVLLVSNGKIMNCLVSKTWRHRQIRPGAEHQFPPARFDPTIASKEEFIGSIASSTSDTVRTLATAGNLGGQYAEEVCLRAEVDKNRPASELADEDLERMYTITEQIVRMVRDEPSPTMIVEGEEAVDVSPIPLFQNEGRESKVFSTYSQALDTFLSLQKEAAEEAFVDPEVQRLERLVTRQKDTIAQYMEEAEELRHKADVIYENYAKVDELLKVLDVQSRKLTWEKLREGAMRIDFVDSIDPSKDVVVAILSDRKVPLKYHEGLDANASLLYQRSKDVADKASRAGEALKETEEKLAKRMKGVEKALASRSKVKPTKQFWFERYKWFFTSNGRLVLAGRDARTNDQVVKKHLKEEDRYAHADVHGAPSVVIKRGMEASEEEMREACIFALAQSKAWTSGFSEGTAYWVLPDQVTKTPQAGEFVPRGAFIIRGKRNYEYHLAVELAVGEITHEGTRKIMCAPTEVVRAISGSYVIIRPGKDNRNRASASLAKQFDVPEEEISRILPPGNIEVVERKGMGE
jgi:predicted ribosome quality control (RQC) complex YloA/Tae2 family protein